MQPERRSVRRRFQLSLRQRCRQPRGRYHWEVWRIGVESVQAGDRPLRRPPLYPSTEGPNQRMLPIA